MERPQYFREGCTELFAALADIPSGADVIVGRGFGIVRAELYDLALQLSIGSREDIEEARDELAKLRPILRALGR